MQVRGIGTQNHNRIAFLSHCTATVAQVGQSVTCATGAGQGRAEPPRRTHQGGGAGHTPVGSRSQLRKVAAGASGEIGPIEGVVKGGEEICAEIVRLLGPPALHLGLVGRIHQTGREQHRRNVEEGDECDEAFVPGQRRTGPSRPSDRRGASFSSSACDASELTSPGTFLPLASLRSHVIRWSWALLGLTPDAGVSY